LAKKLIKFQKKENFFKRLQDLRPGVLSEHFMTAKNLNLVMYFLEKEKAALEAEKTRIRKGEIETPKPKGTKSSEAEIVAKKLNTRLKQESSYTDHLAKGRGSLDKEHGDEVALYWLTKFKEEREVLEARKAKSEAKK